MRLALWAVAIFALAVALTLAAKLDPGYALLVLPPYRVEISLNLLALLVLGTFVTLYVLTRLTAGMLGLPAQVRVHRARRRADKARAAMHDALRAMFEGSYGQAEKLALEAAEGGEAPELSALLAARAAHELREFGRRDSHLARAERAGSGDSLAGVIARAGMLIEERRFGEALAVLDRLPAKARRHGAALRLELRARQQLGQWQQVPELTVQLEKRGVITPEYGRQLRLRAHAENLGRADDDAKALLARWRALPKAEANEARVAAAAARRLAEAGDCDAARRVLETAIEANWDGALVERYGRCDGEDVVQRIQWAERMLTAHPQDATLLLALGRLCASRQLWGKAQSYLEASLSVEPSAAAHLELATLLERLGKTQEAMRHYRLSAQRPAGR